MFGPFDPSPRLSRRLGAGLLLFAATVAPGLAQEAGYTAEDVRRFFEENASSPDAGDPPPALCLGSAAECAQGPAAAQTTPAPLPSDPVELSRLLDASPSFDLLVEFELNSARLTPPARERLRRFAEAIGSPDLARLRFRIEGHTDAFGDADYNRTLSQGRAAAVVAFLESVGIEPGRLEAEGFGETRPRTPDPFDPLNRRVEGRLLPEGLAPRPAPAAGG